MKSNRNITLLHSEIKHLPTSPVVVIHTKAGEIQYPIGQDFTGNLSLDFNEGGLSSVVKKEKLK